MCLREGLAVNIPCQCLGLELLGERFHAHLTVPEICYAFSNIRMNDSSSNHSRCRVLLQLVSTTHSNDWPALINSSADPLASGILVFAFALLSLRRQHPRTRIGIISVLQS